MMKIAAGFVVGTFFGRRLLRTTVKTLNHLIPPTATSTRKAADFAYDVHSRLADMADGYNTPQKENAR